MLHPGERIAEIFVGNQMPAKDIQQTSCDQKDTLMLAQLVRVLLSVRTVIHLAANNSGYLRNAETTANCSRSLAGHFCSAGERVFDSQARGISFRLWITRAPQATPVGTTLSDPPAAIRPPPPTASLIYATSANATSGRRTKRPTKATSPPQHVAEDVTTAIANLLRSSHRWAALRTGSAHRSGT